MESWTQESIQGLIQNKIEESSQREYKAAAALGSSDGQKGEVTKDVSAFANANGGMIIYGLAEYSDKQRKHLPERIDPVNRQEFSKEWLEQIIQQIQPKIEGVVIHPVSINDSATDVCYVVEIPQSTTAHQARDHRYYKRSNFNVLPMENYEIRDVMNRREKAGFQVSISVSWRFSADREDCLLVKLENTGKILIHYAMIEILFPIQIRNSGFISVGGRREICDRDGVCYSPIKCLPPVEQRVIFPQSDIQWVEKIQTFLSPMRLNSGVIPVSGDKVLVAAFADNLPPKRAEYDIETILNKGNVLIQ